MNEPVTHAVSSVWSDLKEPQNLLLYAGIVALLWGLFRGPVSWDNMLIAVGAISLAVSYGWRYLATCKSVVIGGNAYTMQVATTIHWDRICTGIVFLLAAAWLSYRCSAHHWLPFHR